MASVSVVQSPLSNTIFVGAGTSQEFDCLFNEIVNRPLPIRQVALCKVVRRKGTDAARYELYLEDRNDTRVFLLSAKKERHRTRPSEYLVSAGRLSRGDPDFCSHILGRIRHRLSPLLMACKDAACWDQSIPSTATLASSWLRSSTYDPNVLGLGGPRRLTLLLPGFLSSGDPQRFPTQKGESLYDLYKAGSPSVLVLSNKKPQWNEETQSYVLNFYNRVSQASIKNFQLISSHDREHSSLCLDTNVLVDYIVMQFGRVGVDSFSLDFRYPLSGLQAFAIALTSFDPKIICE